MTNKRFSQSDSLKKDLINQLKQKGINDQNVLKAIYDVPREEFVNIDFKSKAYVDDALPIDCNQTISQPFTVAFMTQLLDIEPGMKVLEIGTGSGYQAAILYYLGAKVFSIERHLDLLTKAKVTFEKLGIEIHSLHGDGSMGWKLSAPFDRIIVTASAPEIPDTLLKQLAVNGKLVIPVGDKIKQTMCLVVKNNIGEGYDVFDYGEFKFVPLVGKKGWEN